MTQFYPILRFFSFLCCFVALLLCCFVALLGSKIKAHKILYPLATHHMLEDLDTMWNLWYTHKLPFKWWLEDRSDPCTDLMDRPGVKRMPKRKRNEYFGRMAHQTHVEIFCKSYEYERYLVRSNRGDNTMANWNRPSELGHVHRIPLKLSHFDLHPDGDRVLDESAQKKMGGKDHVMGFDGDGDALNSLNAPKRELNADQQRKEEVIERNQQQLNVMKEQQRLQIKIKLTKIVNRSSPLKSENLGNWSLILLKDLVQLIHHSLEKKSLIFLRLSL